MSAPDETEVHTDRSMLDYPMVSPSSVIADEEEISVPRFFN